MRLFLHQTDEESIFSECLTQKNINFLLLDNSYQLPCDDADNTILVINQNLNEAVKLKEKCPQSLIIACLGGKKNFTPAITFVYGENDYDHDYFTDWNDFVNKILSKHQRQEKYLEYDGKSPFDLNDVYKIIKNSEKKQLPDDTKEMLSKEIISMTEYSLVYIDFLLKCAEEISNIKFPVTFTYPIKKKKAIKIKITVNNTEYKEQTIFSPEDELIFYHGNVSTIGVIETIIENELIIKLDEPLSYKEINQIRCFQKEIDKQTDFLQKRRNLCLAFLSKINNWRDGALKSPMSFLCGKNSSPYENTNEDILEIFLDKRSEKILRDISQIKTLIDILGKNYINLIVGPPGSGKTFLLSSAIKQFYLAKKIILVLSHSNQGLDNLVEEISKHINNDKIIFRLGNNEKRITSDALKFHRSKKMSRAMPESSINLEIQKIENLIEQENGIILACTLNSLLIDRTFSRLFLSERISSKIKMPDIVIIDEGTKGYFYELLPALEIAQEKIIICGDPNQLGNITMSNSIRNYLTTTAGRGNEEKTEYFARGLFVWLIKNQIIETNKLSINRRSLPNINEIISHVFYEGKLIGGRFNPDDMGKIILADTSFSNDNEDEKNGSSFLNRREANLAVYIFSKLLKKDLKKLNCQKKDSKEEALKIIKNFVIITPYSAQINIIKEKIRKILLFDKDLGNYVNPENIEDILDKLIITVDAIQGSERKTVIISLVRSNKNNEIGFNKYIERLNVALSRARDTLIIIANTDTFINCQYRDISQAMENIIFLVKKYGTYIINPDKKLGNQL